MIIYRDKDKKSIFLLHSLFGRKSELVIKTKVSIIQIRLTYGLAIWGYCSAYNIARLQVAQNQAFVPVINVPWTLEKMPESSTRETSNQKSTEQRCLGFKKTPKDPFEFSPSCLASTKP